MHCTVTLVAVQFRDIIGEVFPREETCTVLYERKDCLLKESLGFHN
jgi:hypothetical protein